MAEEHGLQLCCCCCVEQRPDNRDESNQEQKDVNECIYFLPRVHKDKADWLPDTPFDDRTIYDIEYVAKAPCKAVSYAPHRNEKLCLDKPAKKSGSLLEAPPQRQPIEALYKNEYHPKPHKCPEAFLPKMAEQCNSYSEKMLMMNRADREMNGSSRGPAKRFHDEIKVGSTTTCVCMAMLKENPSNPMPEENPGKPIRCPDPCKAMICPDPCKAMICPDPCKAMAYPNPSKPKPRTNPCKPIKCPNQCKPKPCPNKCKPMPRVNSYLKKDC
ncbi:hypothetical protein Ciccas_000365 [Cichlidogyrus casuarinus]|uniref:Uncharacterized protein n=1 Tax=Cichlidogyrus casuarinus TaxID=1844966 RepID=A0ABD2QN38_9PLAT